MTWITELDEHWPPSGPCTFFNIDDARHRIFDAIADRWADGESIEDIAKDYNKPARAIELALIRARTMHHRHRIAALQRRDK